MKVFKNGFSPELYNKIEIYLDQVQLHYRKEFNTVNAIKDQELSKYNPETFITIKNKYFNDYVSDAVMNVDSKQKVIVYKDQLIQKN